MWSLQRLGSSFAAPHGHVSLGRTRVDEVTDQLMEAQTAGWAHRGSEVWKRGDQQGTGSWAHGAHVAGPAPLASPSSGADLSAPANPDARARAGKTETSA